jgi:hypothetical protein
MNRRVVRTMKQRREAAMRACNVLIYGTSDAARGAPADLQRVIDLARLAVTNDPTPPKVQP